MSNELIIWILSIAYVLLIGNTALVVILENRQAPKTIAWLLVLIFLPLIGWILFYFFG
ncbi:MAG: PLDc N-terminal domain-containing protein, partial [Duodenibacillus sp.]|nr:PLDc N-terminal domain-containing protein [Duodenibacillus sp.]